MSLADPISTPESYERWLKILRLLTVVFAIITVVSFVLMFTDNGGDPILSILCLLTTVMFFFAHKEKSKGPRPGSPEYKAMERAREARSQASRERVYRKQHPFSVARELVANNKATARDSYKSSKTTDTTDSNDK